MAIELGLCSLTSSGVHRNALVYVPARASGIPGSQIPTPWGSLGSTDLFCGSILVPSLCFERDPVARTSLLLPAHLPVLLPGKECACPLGPEQVLSKDDEGGLKDSCTQ